MKIYKLSAGAIMIMALCLVFWSPAAVNAETGIESLNLSYHSLATPSSATRATGSNASEGGQWLEAGTAAELSKALSQRPSQEGIRNIRLTDDIIIEEGTFWLLTSPGNILTLVDMGEYTIYVDGTLDIMPEMTFTGKGGEEGLFHVNRGGFLTMCGISVIAEQGIAVWQEDEAVFFHADMLEEQGFGKDYLYYSQGENRFPEIPVVWYPTGYYDYFLQEKELHGKTVIVRPEEDFSDERLPGKDYAMWCIDGIAYEGELEVTWETSGVREELAERKRTFLKGNYSDDYVTFLQPECLVAFQREHAGAMLHCETEDYGDFIYVRLYMVPSDESVSADDYSLRVSADGEQWEVSSGVWKEKTSDGLICMGRRFNEGNGAYPKYYFIAVEHEGTLYGSDTLMLSDMNQLVSSDVDGSRGGGTELLPGSDDSEHDGNESMTGGGSDDSGSSPWEGGTNGESQTAEQNMSDNHIPEPETTGMTDMSGEPGTAPSAGTDDAPEAPRTAAAAESAPKNQKDSEGTVLTENGSSEPSEAAMEHRAASVIQNDPAYAPEPEPALTAGVQIFAGSIITALIFLLFFSSRKR